MELMNQALKAQEQADLLAHAAIFHPGAVSQADLQAAQEQANRLWSEAMKTSHNQGLS